MLELVKELLEILNQSEYGRKILAKLEELHKDQKEANELFSGITRRLFDSKK